MAKLAQIPICEPPPSTSEDLVVPEVGNVQDAEPIVPPDDGVTVPVHLRNDRGGQGSLFFVDTSRCLRLILAQGPC